LAKSPNRKLKVFQAQFGFYDSVVAAPSQAAALKAWGTHQNLFADGQARVATDETAVKAALAHPDTPLRRAVGRTGAFEVEPTSLPTVPNAPKTPKVTRKPSAAPPKPAADRTALDAAEAALSALDQSRKDEEAGFRRRSEALDTERMDAQKTYVERRKTAASAIVRARTAYRDAGGET